MSPKNKLVSNSRVVTVLPSRVDLNVTEGLVIRGVACFRCGKNSCVYKDDVFSFNKFNFYKKRHNMKLAYKDKHFFFIDFCYEVDSEFFEMYNQIDDNTSNLIGSIF